MARRDSILPTTHTRCSSTSDQAQKQQGQKAEDQGPLSGEARPTGTPLGPNFLTRSVRPVHRLRGRGKWPVPRSIRASQPASLSHLPVCHAGPPYLTAPPGPGLAQQQAQPIQAKLRRSISGERLVRQQALGPAGRTRGSTRADQVLGCHLEEGLRGEYLGDRPRESNSSEANLQQQPAIARLVAGLRFRASCRRQAASRQPRFIWASKVNISELSDRFSTVNQAVVGTHLLQDAFSTLFAFSALEAGSSITQGTAPRHVLERVQQVDKRGKARRDPRPGSCCRQDHSFRIDSCWRFRSQWPQSLKVRFFIWKFSDWG